MTKQAKPWEVTTITGRVLESHRDYVIALGLAQYHADKLGTSTILVRSGASLDSGETIGATARA